MSTDITATEFLRQATRTAEYFGFHNIEQYRRSPVCKNCTVSLQHTATAGDRKQDALHGMLTAGINAYTDARLHAVDGPVLFYHIEQVPRTGELALSLQVMGVEKSIAEALLIQTSRAIAADLGFVNPTVRINSIGDSDSITRYTRELTNFLRKRLADLPPAARELMKEHVCDALMHLIEKEHDLANRSPNPLEYLSDASRKHFREIVEFLDMSELSYEIDPKLMGHLNCYSDALFAVDLPAGIEEHGPSLHIRGGRYNTFMQRHIKNNVSAAGAVIVLRGKKSPRRAPRLSNVPAPSVYVVQLGFGPKVRSLMLIDTLRAAQIPVFQNLASDSLSAQLRDAEERNVKYTVIIGQKEYVDGTVILRDMMGRNQEHVPLASLIPRLKRMQTVA